MDGFIHIWITNLQGERIQIECPTDMGFNLMEAIRANELQIKATCGGMAMCATCNVIVKSDHRLPDMSDDEEAMLDEAFVLDTKGSRLACQIPITDELDGLEVQLGELTSE